VRGSALGAATRCVAAGLCVLCAVAVSGCNGPTAFEPPVAVDSSKGRRTIGVISTVGAKFAVQKVGVTVFGNEHNVVPIGAWAIDDAVDAKLASLLGADADVKRIAYGKDAFTAYEAPGGLFRDRGAELTDALRKVTAGQKCDLYLLVIASGSSFGSSNQSVSGLGIVQGSSVFVNQVWIHALFQMRLYDGRTLELLGWKPARHTETAFMAVIHGPHRQVDVSMWPEAGQVESNMRLRIAVRELVEQALAATLPEVLTLEHAKRAY
jgi:hypothetical protein